MLVDDREVMHQGLSHMLESAEEMVVVADLGNTQEFLGRTMKLP